MNSYLNGNVMREVGKIYSDGTYAERNPKFGDDTAEWKAAKAVRAIEQFGIPHRSVAEIGCGGGEILRRLKQALPVEKAIGFEPMPEAFAVAKRRESEGLSYRNELVTEDTEERFDLVLCFDVVEHVEDYFSFLRTLQVISKRFLFHFPLDMNVQMVARASPLERVRKEVGHIHFFSKETALASLRHCGYKIEGSFYTFGAESGFGSRAYRMLKYVRKVCRKIHEDLTVRFLGGYSLMIYASVDGSDNRESGGEGEVV